MSLPVWMLGTGVSHLEEDMSHLIALLFHQGVLDEKFMELHFLQDESAPIFVSEVISIYSPQSEKLLHSLKAQLMDVECTDYLKMGIHLNQLLGSSSIIGAKRMRRFCIAFRANTELKNWTEFVRLLEVMEHEYCYLKNKLHELLQVKTRIIVKLVSADGAKTIESSAGYCAPVTCLSLSPDSNYLVTQQ